MRIFIPTIGRPRQRTVERLPLDVLRKYAVTIVCPPHELNAHKNKYATHVWVCPAKGIAATRQWILNHSDDDIVLMLDDDLPTWCWRTHDRTSVVDAKYKKADDKELARGLGEFERLMRNHAHGSIGHRLFCQTQPTLNYNGRMLRALAYNRKLVGRAKFRLPVMEDFDMALQLLSQGRDAVIYNQLVQDQYATNAAGGCSLYRTPEVQANAAKLLQKTWSEFVTLVTRAPKREWSEGFGGERVDVRVNWRKAARAGGCKYVD